MAQDSWPSPAHNSRAVTDVEYEKIAAHFSEDGVYGTPADTQVVAVGTGLNVAVRADVFASVRGHAWTSGTSTVTLSIGANVSGSTRIDRVVLRLDRSTWTVRAVVRAGTPGSGAPALVQDTGDTGVYEIPLALVSLLSGASTVTVTRSELYVGARIRPATSSTRNPAPALGETCLETDTGRVRMWNGTLWVLVYDDGGGETVIDSPLSAWEILTNSVLATRSGNVHLRLGVLRRAAGTLAGADESRLPILIPAAYRHPNRDQYGLAYVSGTSIGRFVVYAGGSDRPGQVWLTHKPSIATGGQVLPASGLSWVVN
ncbi:hypothetical protein PV396_24355 [Streptomyces sp. ME02-8801-2C]|uniref:hypothetical protein n=1 Tax=Streptomyces sp. ME02-8801-2C TaxID=3028680 RepID=UPI0029AA368F|nr:hypothetical protein [Streptomyces sp. ME02-8801-2C]MDX3455034.1 hypothetical protein [Streptomyces sp. ME02-8801-2C]